MSPCHCAHADATAPETSDAADGCASHEVFALQVIGQSMAPEFSEGEIIVIEPGGALHDGCFVLAQADGEWTFRQLVLRDACWWLHPLNPAWPDQALPDLDAVRGRVIQACVPGRRRLTRHYV